MNNIDNYSFYGGVALSLIGLIYLAMVIYQIYNGTRIKEITPTKVRNFLVGYLAFIPLFIGIWIYPIVTSIEGFLPFSSPEYFTFNPSAAFLIGGVSLFYFFTQFSTFFPHKNPYYNVIPSLLILTTLPGLANSALVIIINQSVTGTTDIRYLLLMFAIAIYVLVLTTRMNSRQVALLGNLVAHDLNVKIFRNVFKFSFRKYEKVASGRVYTILHDDIGSLFFFAQHLPNLYSAAVTVIVVSVYLCTISFVGCMALFAISFLIMVFQNFFTGSIKEVWMKARESREGFTDLITGLVNGFKEVIVHKIKRTEYMSDLENSSKEFYKTHREAMYVDIDKTIFANLSFTFAVGGSCLLFPMIFDLSKELVATFVITTLFLWGPMSAIIGSLPTFFRVRVSWDRIKEFLKNMDEEIVNAPEQAALDTGEVVEKIETNDVFFTYGVQEGEVESIVGPVNFEARKGEVTFVIGGNGSGKTTLLKILVGLYKPSKGSISINGEVKSSIELGEYFSIIYSDFYLFKKIYGIKTERLQQVKDWLKMLGLDKKVVIENGSFNTINLSKGQRKRLSLLRSYLEDRPINIYDECAADLDPEFKQFFYNVLLPEMKKEDKVIIIISHDDGYFDIADRIYKMDMGASKLLKNPKAKTPQLV